MEKNRNKRQFTNKDLVFGYDIITGFKYYYEPFKKVKVKSYKNKKQWKNISQK